MNKNVVPFPLKPTRRVTISTSITTTTQLKPTVPITNSPMKWQRPTPTCTSNSTRQITQQEVIRWGRLLPVARTNTMEAPLTQRVMRSARWRQQMASRLHPTLLPLECRCSCHLAVVVACMTNSPWRPRCHHPPPRPRPCPRHRLRQTPPSYHHSRPFP